MAGLDQPQKPGEAGHWKPFISVSSPSMQPYATTDGLLEVPKPAAKTVVPAGVKLQKSGSLTIPMVSHWL